MSQFLSVKYNSRTGRRRSSIRGLSATKLRHTETSEDQYDETYSPTGDFQRDFGELCQRVGVPSIQVVPRPHPPGPPVVAPAEPTNVKERGKRDHSQTPQQQQQQQQQQPPKAATGEDQDSLPTTYSTKDKFEYFKPKVEVEAEDEGSLTHVKELYIRGWKVDNKITDVLGMTLPKQDRLTTIDLWNTGLTDDTLEALAKIVCSHPSLRHLRLDGNGYLIHQRFDELLKDDSRLQTLSLKNCYVNDTGARNLGTGLLNNNSLLFLNLCFNKITCNGIEHLAKGLRLNRTLLSLNLGSNRIGDNGAITIAGTISKFALSHDEIVARRVMLSKRSSDEPTSPTRSLATTVSRENRPQSVKSGLHMNKDDKKRDKGGSKKKDQQGGKANKDAAGGRRAGNSDASGKATMKGKKTSNVKQEKGRQSQNEPEHQEFEFPHPFLENIEEVNKEIWIPGNRALVNLNLARNNISETGLKALLDAVKYQSELANQMNRTSGVGLMRLSLQKNNFSSDNQLFLQLNETMQIRDPFYKPPPPSPSNESVKDES